MGMGSKTTLRARMRARRPRPPRSGGGAALAGLVWPPCPPSSPAASPRTKILERIPARSTCSRKCELSPPPSMPGYVPTHVPEADTLGCLLQSPPNLFLTSQCAQNYVRPYPPPGSYVEALTPNVFRDGAFRRKLRLNEVIRPGSYRTSVFVGSGDLSPLSVRTPQEAAVCKPGRGPHQTPSLAAPDPGRPTSRTARNKRLLLKLPGRWWCHGRPAGHDAQGPPITSAYRETRETARGPPYPFSPFSFSKTCAPAPPGSRVPSTSSSPS